MIAKTGRGALMGKVDIKSAYRIIPVHLADLHLMGIFWKGKYYVDLALPFGLRSTPELLTPWRIYFTGFWSIIMTFWIYFIISMTILRLVPLILT